MTVAALCVLAPMVAGVCIVLLRRAARALALLGAGVSCLAAAWTVRDVALGARPSATLEWLPNLILRAEAAPLDALLLATVAGVSFFVLVYAVGYMREEEGVVRFFAAMVLFLGAMQALVLAGDWVSFLVAWELLALASYGLIGHHVADEDAAAQAGRAFLTARATDVGLYLGAFTLIGATESAAIAEGATVEGGAAAVAGLSLLVAAAGKAAQVPFQGWLQGAMVGPTPVSALLHSATMVAAGVVLMIRVFPLLSPGVLVAVGVLGGATAVVAGVTALAQTDLKRLLAASTSSQLGLMLLALGAGSVPAAVFHLVAHAAMKSTLFLTAGSFQRGRGSTEFRRLRGVGRERPWAYGGFLLAGLALAGVPPLAGYASKDAVLAAAFHASSAWLLGPLAVAGSLLTALYVARALRLLWRREEPASAHATPAPRASGGSGADADAPSPWMLAGFAATAFIAAVLGRFAPALEGLLGSTFPHATSATVVGLVAAGVGLAAGAFLRSERLLNGLWPAAEAGFRFGGGLAGLVARPVVRIARSVDRWDGALVGFVREVGRAGTSIAGTVERSSASLHRRALGLASAAMASARAARSADERGLVAANHGLVRRTRALGRAARRLQSGLVHRELAWSVGGAAGLLALLVVVGLIV